MTREKMAEMISETMAVTEADARAALEASAWNVLDAAQLVIRQRRAAKVEAARAVRRGGVSAFLHDVGILRA